MNGFRTPAKQEKHELDEINQMIKDYHQHNPTSKQRELNKKIRDWLKFYGKPSAKNMSGFKSFIIEHTKI